MWLSECKNMHNTLVSDAKFDALSLSNSIVGVPTLSFIENKKFLNEINDNKEISCVICLPELVSELAAHIEGIITTESPRLEFFKLHNEFCNATWYQPIEFSSTVGDGTIISPLAYIDSKNVSIGQNVIIEEFASIRGRCYIGDNAVIHSGVQIGGGGYEFKPHESGFLRVSHVGTIKIGNNVEIWSNATIHKAVYPWDSTMIGDSTQINSQVHIDHGAKIGNGVKLCAGAVVSGRAEIGLGAVIGPGSVISNRCKVGSGARVSLGGVVTKDVSENAVVSGNFAIDHEHFLKGLKSLIKDEH